ncbi:MAG: helix-turn-helix domain-containing protein [Janthinobacterium lividum]
MTDSDTSWSGDDFRAWRHRQGWTQAQVAEELCVHPQTIKHIESGRNRVTPIVQRLAQLLEAHHATGRRKPVSPPPTAAEPPSAAPEEDLRLARAVRTYALAAIALADAHRADARIPAELEAAVDEAAEALDVAFRAGATEDSMRKALWLRRLAGSSVALCGLLSRQPARDLALALDARNGTVSDIAGTLLAGGDGGGASLNDATLVLQLKPGSRPVDIRPGDRVVRTDELPPAAPEKASILAKLSRKKR